MGGSNDAARRAASLPIFLCHGKSDEVVAYRFGEKSAQALTSAGFRNLTFKNFDGLGHYTIPMETSRGDSEPCKKIIELLMQLISLVDIQVLPELMKLLARLIIQLPKDGQNMVLNELYALVAESDDVTRKPTLVSWLQSLSYLCSQPTTTNEACTEVPSANSLILQNVTARL